MSLFSNAVHRYRSGGRVSPKPRSNPGHPRPAPRLRLVIIGALGLALEGCVAPEPVRDPVPGAAAPVQIGSELRESAGPAARTQQTTLPPAPVEPDSPVAASEPDTVAAEPAPPPHPGLWSHVARALSLEHEADRQRVQSELRWYRKNPDYIQRVTTRAAPYLPYIVAEIDRRGLPTELALLPVIESAYDPFAYSHSRAAGLWQFVPGTARRYGLRIDWWQDERRDVKRATDAALTHLTDLAKMYNGSWLLALAAYNAGPGNVNRALRRANAAPSDEVFWKLRLPRETLTYVPRLLALSHHVAAEYRVLPVVDSPNPWIEMTFDSQLDLALASELSDVAVGELYALNAGLNRWATPPQAPHRLLLPTASAERFSERLAEVPHAERVAWQRHVIRSGETLGLLANRYKTTVGSIQSANRLRGTVIRAGDTLMIPTARQAEDVHPYTAHGRAEARDARLTDSMGKPAVMHTIQRGDTWWDLSRLYGVGMRELARWNGLGTTDLLRPGQSLKVYKRPRPQGAGRATTPIVSGAAPSAPERTRRLSYRVRKGESLWLIADRFNVSVKDIREWNARASGKYIQPGDRLTLYVDVTATGE
ncbi:MAG: lytic transglycosylase [Gammaproteobacteria bacterium]|nr:lytic transglycosylase [Gammaproteobacteria bacterium]